MREFGFIGAPLAQAFGAWLNLCFYAGTAPGLSTQKVLAWVDDRGAEWLESHGKARHGRDGVDDGYKLHGCLLVRLQEEAQIDRDFAVAQDNGGRGRSRPHRAPSS